MNVNQYIEYIIYSILVLFIIVLAIGIMYALFLAVQSWEKQRAQDRVRRTGKSMYEMRWN